MFAFCLEPLLLAKVAKLRSEGSGPIDMADAGKCKSALSNGGPLAFACLDGLAALPLLLELRPTTAMLVRSSRQALSPRRAQGTPAPCVCRHLQTNDAKPFAHGRCAAPHTYMGSDRRPVSYCGSVEVEASLSRMTRTRDEAHVLLPQRAETHPPSLWPGERTSPFRCRPASQHSSRLQSQIPSPPIPSERAVFVKLHDEETRSPCPAREGGNTEIRACREEPESRRGRIA